MSTSFGVHASLMIKCCSRCVYVCVYTQCIMCVLIILFVCFLDVTIIIHSEYKHSLSCSPLMFLATALGSLCNFYYFCVIQLYCV